MPSFLLQAVALDAAATPDFDNARAYVRDFWLDEFHALDSDTREELDCRYGSALSAECGTDSDAAYRGLRDDLNDALDALQDELTSEHGRPDTETLTVRGVKLLLTGGDSAGDDPTQMYDYLWLLEHCGVLEQLNATADLSAPEPAKSLMYWGAQVGGETVSFTLSMGEFIAERVREDYDYMGDAEAFAAACADAERLLASMRFDDTHSDEYKVMYLVRDFAQAETELTTLITATPVHYITCTDLFDESRLMSVRQLIARRAQERYGKLSPEDAVAAARAEVERLLRDERLEDGQVLLVLTDAAAARAQLAIS